MPQPAVRHLYLSNRPGLSYSAEIAGTALVANTRASAPSVRVGASADGTYATPAPYRRSAIEADVGGVSGPGLVNTPVVLGSSRLLERLARSLNLTPQRGCFGIYGETCHQGHSQISSELWPLGLPPGRQVGALFCRVNLDEGPLQLITALHDDYRCGAF